MAGRQEADDVHEARLSDGQVGAGEDVDREELVGCAAAQAHRQPRLPVRRRGVGGEEVPRVIGPQGDPLRRLVPGVRPLVRAAKLAALAVGVLTEALVGIGPWEELRVLHAPVFARSPNRSRGSRGNQARRLIPLPAPFALLDLSLCRRRRRVNALRGGRRRRRRER